jgi:peptidoglycan/xylan/chitin deacetylase (PgdA/CDA1 family)
LPILHYDATQPGVLEQLAEHGQKLKQAGYKFMTLREFHDLVLAQEQKDARLDPKSVVIAITELNAENVRKVSDALFSNGMKATLFLQSGELGMSGITEKNLLTLLANGFDLQSAGHTGDDLRSLTNAQVKLELEQSRQLLQEYTKKDVIAVAYPQGGVNDRVMQTAANAGYLFGLGSAPESTFARDQFLRLPSFSVTANMTGDDILAAVK